MISHISIRNFAIIENTEISFYDGLNVITGETGAGKSIVIEAISLALGSRADTAFVRSGRDKAVIQLVSSSCGEEMIITREISAAGKSLCKINGEIVTLAQLSRTCKEIADIHGQYDHQSLLNQENHINILDSYDSKAVSRLKAEVQSLFSKYNETKNKLAGITANHEDNLNKRGFMRYELDEIRKAGLAKGEDETLKNEISLLQNSEKIYQNLSNAYEISYAGVNSSLDGLKKSLSMLLEIGGYSKEISGVAEEFQEAYYKLEDLCRDIRNIRDRISFSEEDLEAALSRLDLIDSLKRKYGGSIEKALKYAEDIEDRLSYIENIDEAKESLSMELGTLEADLKRSSEELSALRKDCAKELERQILSELMELNFNDASLSIDIARENSYSSSGVDKVEFLLSANKGEALKPLSKIASGGEMSRIMLAFKKIIADYDDIPTMIFDEIDSGVSGITASIVGKKLRQIAENHQVICITHLPQIAAFGKHNYKIQKDSDDNMTYTTVAELDEDAKILEVARLLGGINITGKTIENARELIALSD